MGEVGVSPPRNKTAVKTTTVTLSPTKPFKPLELFHDEIDCDADCVCAICFSGECADSNEVALVENLYAYLHLPTLPPRACKSLTRVFSVASHACSCIHA